MASNIQAIQSAFNTWFKAIADNYSTAVPTQYDNMPFTPPEEGLWCRFTVVPGESVQTEINAGSGGNARTVGLAIAQLFYPFEGGTKPQMDFADTIVNGVTPGAVSGVTLRVPSPQRVGRAGKWWQVNVTVPWQADRTL